MIPFRTPLFGALVASGLAGCSLQPVEGAWKPEVEAPVVSPVATASLAPVPPPAAGAGKSAPNGLAGSAHVTAPRPALKEASIKPVPEPIAMSPVLPEGGGHAVFKVGKPYEVAGQTYVPKEEPSYNATGLASWYGGLHQGTMTANGERFDATKLTAAHTTLPMPSYVLVTNLANNRTVMLRVNNRGPFTKNRILDVSKSAADLLGFSKFGVARVRVTYAGRAPLDGDTSKETAFLEGQPWYKAATSTTAAATAKAPSTAPDARAAGLADTAH